MRKIAILGILWLFLSCSVAQAGDIYFSGYMYGSGKQHVIWEDRSLGYTLKQLQPIVWATAGYIGALALEKVVLLPSTAVHGWKLNAQQVELRKAQVKRYKRETEFIYQIQNEKIVMEAVGDSWKDTPRGKKFLADLSTQVHSRPTYYYFDTGD